MGGAISGVQGGIVCAPLARRGYVNAGREGGSGLVQAADGGTEQYIDLRGAESMSAIERYS